MPENMKIVVDYQVQKAITEGAKWANTIVDQERNLDRLDKVMDKFGNTVNETSADLAKNTAAVERSREATEKAEKELAAFGARMDQVRASAGQLGQGVASATAQAGKSAETAGEQVIGWVKGYAGLQAALHLLQMMNDASRKQIEAQKELANSRMSQEELLQVTQRNLGLFTPGSGPGSGAAQTRAIVEDMQRRTNMTFEQSAALISSANATNFKPMTALGSQSTEILGKFGAAERLDHSEIESTARLIAQKGIQDKPEEIKEFLGTLLRTFQSTGTTDMGSFVRAASSTLGLARQKGLDEKEALELLGASITTEHSSDFAADRMKMVLRMGEGVQPKVAAFLAAQAKKQGLINTPDLTIADIERMADAGDEDKKGHLEALRKDTLAATRAEREAGEAEAAPFVENTRGFTHKYRTQYDQEKAITDDREKRLDMRAKATAARRTRDRMEKQLVGEEQASINMASFQALPLSKSIGIYTEAFSGTGTGDIQARRAIMAEMGGRPELSSAVAATAQSGFVLAREHVRESINKPGAAETFEESFETFKSGPLGERNRMTGEQQAAGAAGVGEGKLFANQFADSAIDNKDSAYTRFSADAGMRKRYTAGDGGNFTDAAVKFQVLRHQGLAYIAQMWAMMTVEERKKYGPEFDRVSYELSMQAGLTGNSALVGGRAALAHLGYIRGDILKNRRAAGIKADFSGIKLPEFTGEKAVGNLLDPNADRGPFKDQPSNQPFTHPGAENGGDLPGFPAAPATTPGPQSFRGGGGGVYNIHVGNFFSNSGAETELTGRLEGLG